MLELLDIRNLATVTELSVEFGEHLNVMTGETGAGKSIILGALQTLLGDRAEKSLIRKGEDSCEISAVFRLPPPPAGLPLHVHRVLEQSGLPVCEENLLLLRRIVTANGSRAYVNAAPVTLQVMRQFGDLLVDIHGPNDHQSLLQPRCQLELLDTFASLDTELAACRRTHDQVKLLDAEIVKLEQEHLSPGECELLRHQLVEIDQARLDPDEEPELIERHRLGTHARRLLEIAGQAQGGLTEGDSSVCDQLTAFVRLFTELEEIAGANLNFKFLERLEQTSADIQEISRDLTDFADSLELDGAELNRLDERLGLIHKLKRKHGGEVTTVLERAEQIRARLETVEHREEKITGLMAQRQQVQADLNAACRQLHDARAQAAGELATAIGDKLRKLGFAQGNFLIDLKEVEPGPRGADRIEFCFAPNPGEELMPLRKIASSGEIARIMLAVKTVLTAADQVPVLVFDEVDANIGGRVAISVAAELAAIARRHQVLCITHLPQIAAAGAQHFMVGKEIENARTVTRLFKLDQPGRIAEIARMMGAAEDSETAKQHAAELLARQ